MLVDIALEKASRLINCGELIMVSCAYQTQATITPCAWRMPVSRTPALCAIALATKHFSSELIIKSKEFIINIPHWDSLDKVIHCASASGRTQDKFKTAGLRELAAKALTHAKAVAGSIGFIECRLADTHQSGDHYLFTGQIVSAYADDVYFHDDLWDLSRCQLIMHCGGDVFFRSSRAEEFKR